MQMTHEEAQQLIQLNMDLGLSTSRKQGLIDHLEQCVECANYAQEVGTMEEILKSTMQMHWNARVLPIKIEDIQAKIKSTGWTSSFLPTRRLMLGLAVI